MSATEDNTTRREGVLTTYCHFVNYLLKSYAHDDVIAEAEADLMNQKQPENISSVCYT